MNIVNPPREDVTLPKGQTRLDRPHFAGASARRTLWIVAVDNWSPIAINTWVVCDNEGEVLAHYTCAAKDLPRSVTRTFKRK